MSSPRRGAIEPGQIWVDYRHGRRGAELVIVVSVDQHGDVGEFLVLTDVEYEHCIGKSYAYSVAYWTNYSSSDVERLV